jgi:hypothetical protein
MSRQAVVLCGGGSVESEDVSAICHWMKIFAADLDSKTRKYHAMHRSGTYSGEDLEYFRETLKTKDEVDFETMLIHARLRSHRPSRQCLCGSRYDRRQPGRHPY